MRLLHGQEVEWRTPNGNPINPFFFLPALALHAIWPPSIVLLRLVPLASGLAALALNYWLCRARVRRADRGRVDMLAGGAAD